MKYDSTGKGNHTIPIQRHFLIKYLKSDRMNLSFYKCVLFDVENNLTRVNKGHP